MSGYTTYGFHKIISGTSQSDSRVSCTGEGIIPQSPTPKIQQFYLALISM